MAADCLFCKIVAGQIPSHKLHEDDQTLAFLDIRPLTKGHALVISKKHAVKLEDLAVDEARAVMAAIHRLAPKIQKAVGAPSSTIALHNGKEAGQEIAHLHFHIVPRSGGDGGGPIHALFRSRPTVSPEELAGLAREFGAR